MLVLLSQMCLATIAVYVTALQVGRYRRGHLVLAALQAVAGAIATERRGSVAITLLALAWLVVVGRFGREVAETELRPARPS